MAPRANWKGYLEVGELSCPVALYTAASTAERISFNTLNRKTGNRVNRQFVDTVTGKPVPTEDQVKGYEVGSDEYIILEPEEIAAAVPDSDKRLAVSAFVPLAEIDDVYLDRPYYLGPDGRHAVEAYGLIREGLKSGKVAALARTVLFRRLRTVMVTASGSGLIATTLNFDYEIRSAENAFADIPDIRIKGEMLDLARHIIETKRGTYKPEEFDDRYEEALAELIALKRDGKPITVKKPAKPDTVVDLMQALRESAGALGGKTPAKKAAARKPATRKAAPERRKAG